MVLLYNFIDLFFNLLSLAILARALLSWFAVSPYHPVVRILDQITEPIMAPLRRYVPPIGMIDITPIVALVLIQIIRELIVRLLFGL
jgi:YggT family protein